MAMLVAQAHTASAPVADGTTPLHRAAYDGDVDEVHGLIKSGADVRQANVFGMTPLMLASVTGNSEVIRLLLDAGAPANAANAEGQTPLMVVARTGDRKSVV